MEYFIYNNNNDKVKYLLRFGPIHISIIYSLGSKGSSERPKCRVLGLGSDITESSKGNYTLRYIDRNDQDKDRRGSDIRGTPVPEQTK